MSTATADAEIVQGQNTANMQAGEFDPCRHNGIVTIHNPRTNGHRTFRIRTITDGDLEGRRVVELLIGSSNTSDYLPFGFVDSRGITVWVKYRSDHGDKPSAYEKYARYLSRPTHWSSRAGLQFVVSGRCRRCNRLLTTRESVETGLGPVCVTRC